LSRYSHQRPFLEATQHNTSYVQFIRPIGLIGAISWQPPKKQTLATAEHTLPSSVPAHVASAFLLTVEHSLLTCCFKDNGCLANQGCIEVDVAFVMSPDPAFSTSVTITDVAAAGTGGEEGVVWQPTTPPKHNIQSKQPLRFIKTPSNVTVSEA
jgi:hypothetical protein